MKAASVRDLRTRFPVLARWIEDGESIDITRRGRVIAHLTPAASRIAGKAAKPDIMKRLREIYGDYVMEEPSATRGGVPLLFSRGEVVTIKRIGELLDQERV